MNISVANVTAQDLAPPVATGASQGETAERPRRRRFWLFTRKQPGDLLIYQHSNLFYWWVVWAYGYICALITFFGGIGIKRLAATEEKEILFHKSPWLGISFVALVLFVIVFTNVRARGVYSFVLLLVAAGLVWGASRIPGIGVAMDWVSLLRIHLNLGFYLAFSSALALIWLFVVVFVDHFTWFRFSPGQVIEEHWLGQATGHAYNTEGMVVRRLPDDFFRHRVLGLGLVGLGTGDFMVRPPHDESFEVHNVWRANKKQRHMEDMIAMRMMEAATSRKK
jgi:hypothetical protein